MTRAIVTATFGDRKWCCRADGRTGRRTGRARCDPCRAGFHHGGRLNAETDLIDGQPAATWAANAAAELAAMENVRLMPRTTVYGAYDHGVYGALERITDHRADPGDAPAGTWRIFSKRAVLCRRSIERPIAFGQNDRPGIMLAGAVREYANRYAVAAGQNVTVFTNNNDGWRTAHDLTAAGVHVGTIIDTRDATDMAPPQGDSRDQQWRHSENEGRGRVRQITLTSGEVINTDCVAVSGAGHQQFT